MIGHSALFIQDQQRRAKEYEQRYLHWDGIPPQDDDNDYRWNGSQWIADDVVDKYD